MDHVSVHGETIVPFTTDYMVNQFGAFAVKGHAVYKSSKCIYLLGDATHNETSQGLKKLMIGAAGTHFHRSQWSNTILSAFYCACSQETKKVVNNTLQALDLALHKRFGLRLVDLVAGW